MCRLAQDAFLDRATQIIRSNMIIEALVSKHFQLTSDELTVLDEIIGPHPQSYLSTAPIDTHAITELWKKPVSDVVEFCIQKNGPRRQLTKKSFIADRKLELICHGLRLPAETVAYAIKSAGCLDQGTLYDAGTAEVSLAVGCAFGRWDVRFATGEKPIPEFPDPFAPLPVCSPGVLQNERGLPLTKDDVRHLQGAGQWHYPLDVPWDSVLVDDPGDSRDLEARIHQALQVIWQDSWEAIEHEVCAILGVDSLRNYIRKPAGFFADHLKGYSKSRRQAPIYWPLSTASGSYTLWVYYHRLTHQTLHTALADFLEPKIKSIEVHARRQQDEGRTQKYGESIEFLDELKDLRAEIECIINLPWKPNLNDGVLITASPLWKLFRFGKWQKDLKACWQELERGDYDWAHLAFSIWPDRVKEKCKTDRSLAIVHHLEELCTVEPAKPTKRKRGLPE
jgi:hypothetical protein